jgi:hypothetical protein
MTEQQTTAGTTERPPDEVEERAARLFDLRRVIGGVFLLYGLVMTILGLTASDADIEKAAGVNINLWMGLAMLALGGLFWLWALTRPLGSDEPGGRPGGDGERFRRDADAGGQ